MSRNMRTMRHKVRNGQNLPNESLNFSNYFFQSNFTYNFSHFSTSLRLLYGQMNLDLNVSFLKVQYTLPWSQQEVLVGRPRPYCIC